MLGTPSAADAASANWSDRASRRQQEAISGGAALYVLGGTRRTPTLRVSLSSTVPPNFDTVVGGSLALSFFNRGIQGRDAPRASCPGARQPEWSKRYAAGDAESTDVPGKLESRKLTGAGTVRPFSSGIPQRLQGRERSALFVGRRPVTYFPDQLSSFYCRTLGRSRRKW